MRIGLLILAICLLSSSAFAGDEIVFRFTEEQALAACTGPGSAALHSEDGDYMLICRDPNHWGLGKKAETLPGGNQLWRPVVRTGEPDPASLPEASQ